MLPSIWSFSNIFSRFIIVFSDLFSLRLLSFLI
nr:MAG TPA: hypothetical protein [Caudoviricetes sp.]